MSDEDDELGLFVDAQDSCHSDVVAELTAGKKRTHWMWFVFPQIAGLGQSQFSQLYAINDVDEAMEYLAHPVLGARLAEMAQLMLTHRDTPASEILGEIDAKKLRSSMTLFSRMPNAPAEFRMILDVFYDGAECNRTLEILDRQAEFD